MSPASVFGYRNGKIPISNKAWGKLEQAEKAAGVQIGAGGDEEWERVTEARRMIAMLDSGVLGEAVKQAVEDARSNAARRIAEAARGEESITMVREEGGVYRTRIDEHEDRIRKVEMDVAAIGDKLDQILEALRKIAG